MKVYNTLSARKEEFLPQGDEVKMYVCGITPYDHSHIGHGMSYIVFDVIQRYLQFRGYKVKYVQNITDIDDKIINRANQLGIPASELAEKYARGYFKDMADLNIAPAYKYPRATHEIAKITEVIQGLINKGYAYATHGSVYFRVKCKDDYGKLAHRSLKSMMAGASIEAGEEKEHPMDFVLWKAAKPGEPSWPSPWGEGRPGWHIECSAMSLKYLGETLDIHGGGQDLIFPHHENEIAQSESFTGKKPFVKYWLHNGLLQLGEEKMSKSLGNLITIQEALEMYSADAIRIFVLSSHYRSPLTFSDKALEAAESGAERLSQSIRSEDRVEVDVKLDVDTYKRRFIEAMDDDFNTPKALATLFDLARELNRLRDAGHGVMYGQLLLMELGEVLGLTFKPKKLPINVKTLFESTSSSLNEINRNIASIEQKKLHKLETKLQEANQLLNEIEQIIASGIDQYILELPSGLEKAVDNLIEIRNDLRAAKLYKLADHIRTNMEKAGVALEDTPMGTVWKRKR